MVGKYDASHCDDCGGCGEDCTDCCTGAMPSIMRVTFSGVTGVYCCTNLNGSYDLERIGDTCSWAAPVFGSNPVYTVSITKTGDTCTLRVYALIYSCVGGFEFNIFVASEDYTALDCCTLDVTLPLSYTGPDSCSGGSVRVQGVCLVDCGRCESGTAPSQMIVEVSGIVNDSPFPTCTDCNDLNITWVCTYDEDASDPDYCIWYSDYVEVCSNNVFFPLPVRMRVEISTDGMTTGIKASIVTSDDTERIAWTTELETVDCFALDQESLSLWIDILWCDPVSSTCRISSP